MVIWLVVNNNELNINHYAKTVGPVDKGTELFFLGKSLVDELVQYYIEPYMINSCLQFLTRFAPPTFHNNSRHHVFIAEP